MTMHTSADASQEACGAAWYVRYLHKDGTVTCCLATSKSHVAPLQGISIPRLEFMATVEGLKLVETIGRVLGIDKSKLVGDLTPWTCFTGSEGTVERLNHL